LLYGARRFGSWHHSRLQMIGCRYTDIFVIIILVTMFRIEAVNF